MVRMAVTSASWAALAPLRLLHQGAGEIDVGLGAARVGLHRLAHLAHRGVRLSLDEEPLALEEVQLGVGAVEREALLVLLRRARGSGRPVERDAGGIGELPRTSGWQRQRSPPGRG